MIRLGVRRGLLGTDGIEHATLEARPGLTPRAIAHQFAIRLPKSVPILCAVNGEELPDDQLDVDLPDGVDVLLLPQTSSGIDIGALIVQALIATAVSFAVNYALQQLLPRPKPAGLAAERGDQSSATYAWDGIATNYTQGFPVPWVYGRDGVGGTVISSDLLALTSTDGVLDDRLRIVLALGEGPIAAIGDTPAAELDDLGGDVSRPLPSDIRVNGNLLESTQTAITVRQIVLTASWTGTEPAVGDTLFIYDAAGVVQQGTLQVRGFNNAQKTDIDCLELSVIPPALSPIGAAGQRVRFLDAAVIGQATIQSAFNTLRLVGSPGARAWIRPGDLDQSPLPTNPFRGSSVAFSPQAALNEVNEEAIYTYEGTDEISTVAFVVAFPAGLYAQGANGALAQYSVVLRASWRPVGSTTWRSFYRPQGNGSFLSDRIVRAARFSTLLDSFGGDLTRTGDPPVAGPIEVRLQRLSPGGGSDTSSACVWRNVSFNQAQILAYPRVALLGLELTAGARFAGGLPNVKCRIDGLLVRVWDEAEGFSPRTWNVPAAPFDFMLHPPGRNPAWILLDFLTAPWGLGAYLTDQDLDLASFRRWAAFCDSDPSPSDPWDSPAFQCDLVGDTPRPAWEWVLAICAAGRATPVYRNGKLGIVYQYRDAHGDAGIAIPAKTVTQLITAGNCQDVAVTWLPKANRFNVLQYQFVDEDQDYAQNVLTVPDLESSMDDPASLRPEEWRPQTVQAYGVTRRAQLWREGVWSHRITRLVRRELVFTCGPQVLAAEIGDLIDFEHELLRPFGTDVPVNMCVTKDALGVNQIEVDHVVVGATQIVARGEDGVPITRTITGIVVSGSISRLTVSGSPVTLKKGATCVVGLTSKLTETYQIVAITLQKDLRREVRALQWVPEVYDEITPTEYADGGFDVQVESVLRQPNPDAEPSIEDLRVTALHGGQHEATWARPANRPGASTRLYLRDQDRDTWTPIGETAGEAMLVSGLTPGRSYTIAASLQRSDGEWQFPDVATQVDYAAEEFPPSSPQPLSNLFVLDAGDHVLVSWDPQGARDVVGYELREGSDWTSGRVLYTGSTPLVRLLSAPLGGSAMVAARSSSGLYGPPRLLTLPDWKPRGTVQAAFLNDFATTPGGTHSGTAFGSGVIALTGSLLSGTYESPELDLGYQAAAWWQVSVDTRELDLLTVDEAQFEVGSGEARWRTANGRPASPAAPGIDWETAVDDVAVLVDDLPASRLVHGLVGETGSHTRVLVESRFFAGGVWSSYARHGDQWRSASKLQVRLTLQREDARYQPSVSRLRLAANL